MIKEIKGSEGSVHEKNDMKSWVKLFFIFLIPWTSSKTVCS